MPFASTKKRDPVGEPELFEYAVGTLARKMRTVRDLKRLMKPRAHEGEQGERDMDAVVTRLIELKYLSDTRFAADYTRMRKENQSFGRRRVQQDLAQKGVSKELVETTLAAAYDEADEVELARQYTVRKRMKPPADQKETVRTMNRLMRAGYSSNAIFKLLRTWNVAEEAIPEVGGDSDSYAEPDERAESDD
ncbi:regulatory protein [Granulicella rosea]|uniref:Regulatory protein RecX n=1 Tax=Granulicella rosea TaxID=474952 RepID=A0A239LIL1_9BACT|nr:regulatory protein RecX [Granulicella rosea]SNT30120.1 regulatory protein [Granulicella rosea]